MKKIILAVSFYFIFYCQMNSLYAQAISYRNNYLGGNYLDFYTDVPKSKIYNLISFPNQPNTILNYLPNAKYIELSQSFLKTDTVSLYRYTIIKDNIPLLVNQSFDLKKLKEKRFDKNFNQIELGIHKIENSKWTFLLYKVSNPEKIYKTVCYAKSIPASKVEYFSEDYLNKDGATGWTRDPENNNNIKLSVNEKAIDVVRSKTDFDWYTLTIKEKATGRNIFESMDWNYRSHTSNDDYLPAIKVDKSFFKKPGEYEVIIRPLIKWDDCSDCNFPPQEIEKYVTRHTFSITLDEENYSKKDLLIYGLIICAVFGAIAGALLTYVKKKEAKKLAQQYKEKEIIELQLSSVRSQLNPHFLFNALAGIQNLMNKNEIDNANKYLSKFARLTRNVLNNKELVSLAQEKMLLDDYLQMEQLRFGFSYEIKTDDNLDLQNIEIPSMLLQPFVENAVKHGIASKNKDGKIEVNFSRSANNLILTITDNGKGFEANKQRDGLGLSLSKNRITLLNSIYKETPFVLSIKSNSTGTKISLTLTDWL